MEQAPKYYTFRRSTLGNLNAATKVLNKLSTLGISGGIISPLATLWAGSKIDLLLPILAGLVAYTAQMLNDVILYVISVSDVSNPKKQTTDAPDTTKVSLETAE